MQIAEFTGCCNAVIGYNLGGTYACMWDERKTNRKQLEDDLKRTITYFGHLAIVVTTNNQQTVANDLLREYGFKSSDWMAKNQHPETVFKIWWREPHYDEEIIKLFRKYHVEGKTPRGGKK